MKRFTAVSILMVVLALFVGGCDLDTYYGNPVYTYYDSGYGYSEPVYVVDAYYDDSWCYYNPSYCKRQ